MKKIIYLFIFFILAFCKVYAQDYRSFASLQNHTAPIIKVCYSPSGKLLASGDAEGNIIVWKIASRFPVATLKGHTNKITDLNFNRDENLLISASYDGTIKVWDIQANTLKESFESPSIRSADGIKGNEPTFVYFLDDQKTIIYGGYNMKIMKVNTETKKSEELYAVKGNGITCGIISPDYKKVAFGYGGYVEVVDIASKKSLARYGEYKDFTDFVCEIDINATDNTLAYWTAEGAVEMYNLTTGASKGSWKVSNEKGSSLLRFSNDGQYLLTGNDEYYVNIWKTSDQSNIQKLGKFATKVNIFDIRTDGKYIAIVEGQRILLWLKGEPDAPEAVALEIEEESKDVKEGIAALKPTKDATIDLRIQFEKSQNILLEESFSKLDEVVVFMQKYATVKIQLEGHTDNVGFAVLNQRLSEERAKSAKEYLVKKGIEAERIKIKGFGGTKPIADNKKEETRKLNRRVELRILEL